MNCIYKPGVSANLYTQLTSENTSELNFTLLVNKLRDLKEYHMIKLQSFSGEENVLKKVYKILKNKLAF